MVQPVFTIGPSNAAKEIREEVFVVEQGFQEEFDDIDAASISLVLYLDGYPIATGRLVKIDPATYQIGRVAVRKPYRGQKVGTYLMRFLCQKAKSMGAKTAIVHSQFDKREFYNRVGFTEINGGEVDEEEGVPHIYLAKDLRTYYPKRRKKQ
ncbi:MAG: GNAT family N-acetyltransferase [Bacilli bacterium]|nr:GNAT family N-acetyltransferase [Bacilli bacterium]